MAEVWGVASVVALVQMFVPTPNGWAQALPPHSGAEPGARAASDWARGHQLAAEGLRALLQGDAGAAVALLERAVLLVPDSAAIFEDLATAYASLGMLVEARHAMERARALGSTDPEATAFYATVLARLGSEAEAREVALGTRSIEGDLVAGALGDADALYRLSPRATDQSESGALAALLLAVSAARDARWNEASTLAEISARRFGQLSLYSNDALGSVPTLSSAGGSRALRLLQEDKAHFRWQASLRSSLQHETNPAFQADGTLPRRAIFSVGLDAAVAAQATVPFGWLTGGVALRQAVALSSRSSRDALDTFAYSGGLEASIPIDRARQREAAAAAEAQARREQVAEATLAEEQAHQAAEREKQQKQRAEVEAQRHEAEAHRLADEAKRAVEKSKKEAAAKAAELARAAEAKRKEAALAAAREKEARAAEAREAKRREEQVLAQKKAEERARLASETRRRAEARVDRLENHGDPRALDRVATNGQRTVLVASAETAGAESRLPAGDGRRVLLTRDSAPEGTTPSASSVALASGVGGGAGSNAGGDGTMSSESRSSGGGAQSAAIAASMSASVESKERAAACPAGMALVGEGSFVLGSAASDPERDFDDLAQKQVEVSAFCIDFFEYPNGRGRVPTTNVTWASADERCKKRGKRLCTEEEWEKACKGMSGTSRYPYGAAWSPETCNTEDEEGNARPKSKSGEFKTCRSGYNVFDLAGNVSEWTATRDGSSVITKGGSGNRPGYDARCAARRKKKPQVGDDMMGFRCCSSLQTP